MVTSVTPHTIRCIPSTHTFSSIAPNGCPVVSGAPPLLMPSGAGRRRVTYLSRALLHDVNDDGFDVLPGMFPATTSGFPDFRSRYRFDERGKNATTVASVFVLLYTFTRTTPCPPQYTCRLLVIVTLSKISNRPVVPLAVVMGRERKRHVVRLVCVCFRGPELALLTLHTPPSRPATHPNTTLCQRRFS